MNTKELLTELNLSEREATLYLALLENGQGTPTTLSQKTGIKRPTVYLDLESLRRKRLVGLSIKGKRTIYVPDPPSRLLQHVEEQKKTALEIMPYLKAIHGEGERKPQVRYLDDMKEMRRFYENITSNVAESCFISHFDAFRKTFPGLPEAFQRKIGTGEVKGAKEIFTNTPEDIVLAKKYNSPQHQIRIMPKGLEFDLDISIWDEGVALFSAKDLYILQISGEAVIRSFQTLFAMLWNAAKKPGDLQKRIERKNTEQKSSMIVTLGLRGGE